MKSGTCRDFAYLMVEAVRLIGFPARFVSGYLYDEEEVDTGALVGGASTHAWAEIHLPGAGWVEFDPTNDLVGGRNLIQSSVVHIPSEARPISGSYTGFPKDFLGMSVDVSTRVARRGMESSISDSADYSEHFAPSPYI